MRDTPGVIAKPPFIYLGFIALGAAADFAWPAPFLPLGAQLAAGFLLIAAGVALAAACLRQLHRAGTTHKVEEATTRIVTEGPYRLSRNPIYVGLASIHAGVGLAADSPWILAGLPPALLVIRWGVIAREEAYLERKFGEAYLAYKATARRWI